MSFIDTHAHLYSEEFKDDRTEVVKRAKDMGVKHFFLPNVDSKSIEAMLELEKDDEKHFHPMMGLHPCSVNGNVENELEVVKRWLDKRSFSAVGEIGIDLYWDKTYLAEQQYAFKMQCTWALEKELPIVIHCRDAFDEIYESLLSIKEKNSALPTGIFHCFSGNYEQAQKVIELDFLLGIGGVITFKNAGLDKVIDRVDIKHIVLETDAPYLAPVPYRGKRNESAYLPIVAQKLAEIKKCSVEEIAARTTETALKLFNV
jgi:TatD DNase family protein